MRAAAAEVAREVRVLRDVGEDLGPLRPHDVAVQAALVVEVEALPEQGLQVVEAASADDHQAVSLDHLDGAAVVGHDSLQLADDRLDGVLEAQRLPQHLRHGQERLGVLPCPLDLGEVVVDGEEAHVRAFDAERSEHQLDVDSRAVLPPAARDPLGAAGCDRLACDLASLVATRVADHEVVDRAAERLVGGIAEEGCGGRVPVRHPLVGVHDDHRHRAVLDEGLELGQPPARLGELRGSRVRRHRPSRTASSSACTRRHSRSIPST